jgi:hypothetical protein
MIKRSLYAAGFAVVITGSLRFLGGLPSEIAAGPGRFLIWAVGRFTTGPTVVNLFSIENWTRLALVFNALIWWGIAFLTLWFVSRGRTRDSREERAA